MVIKQKPIELPPEITVQGVVFAVYDGGLQPDKFNPGSSVHKIKLGIELNEMYEKGQFAGSRMTRYPEFTASLGDKSNLLQVVQSILGRALSDDERAVFELDVLIGKNCTVQIIHKTSASGNTYATDKISALMKNVPLIQPVLKPFYLPEFIKKWQSEGARVVNHEVTANDFYNEFEPISEDAIKGDTF
jgi:hypothetical protein